jgi:hypothetical protein
MMVISMIEGIDVVTGRGITGTRGVPCFWQTGGPYIMASDKLSEFEQVIQVSEERNREPMKRPLLVCAPNRRLFKLCRPFRSPGQSGWGQATISYFIGCDRP